MAQDILAQSMRQNYLIQLEKAKALMSMTERMLTYQNLPIDLKEELDRYKRRYTEDIEHYSAKIESIDRQ